jgi:hypothetical protein
LILPSMWPQLEQGRGHRLIRTGSAGTNGRS